MKSRVVIMGAAGRDYHDFNTFFRGNEEYEVVAFTHSSTQNIGELGDEAQRRYPPELAGELYPEGIPILLEKNLEKIIKEKGVDEVVLSYSDLSHEYVMNQASRVLSAGANFKLIGPEEIMLESEVPVIAIDAVRTGCGKSQVSQKIAGILKDMGKKVAVVREPMPYGDLNAMKVQRFETREDLDRSKVTIEEREEYERHVDAGNIVYAGVDYEAILREAEKEADIIIWEGGNNELPFFRPDVHFVLADAVRPGHEISYHPGETNLRMADYVIINKEDQAEEGAIETITKNVKDRNPDAEIIHANSVVTTDEPENIKDKKVLIVEDGPTLTHGGTSYGAGWIAAEKYGASEIADPHKSAQGSIKRILDEYPQLKKVLPAMGYSEGQVKELEDTIQKTDCESIVVGSPFDLTRVIDVDKPAAMVRYMVEEKGRSFEEILKENGGVLGL